MKIIGIIPARYKSSRFEGKPLADIHGKPMIWWVYQNLIQVNGINEVYVATDDKRISTVCEEYGINYLMTSNKHITPTDRIHEVSEKIYADLYVSVNGDEPLITAKTIEKIIPYNFVENESLFISNLVSEIKNPVELADPSNLKVALNKNNKGIYISRGIVPYPKGSLEFTYKKHLGVYAFNKKALNFYNSTERGFIEEIEDIDLLRFIENGILINFQIVESKSLSVDTRSDLETVISILKDK
jgi:3-deoxy-manno-octulosonate cytidylyltransferase (CMP-KDO synthetase)